MELLTLSATSVAARKLVAGRVRELVQSEGGDAAGHSAHRTRFVHAVLAFEGAFEGRDIERVRSHARGAVADGALPTDPVTPGGFGRLMSATALMWCDELEEADGLFGRMVDEARERGNPVGLSSVLGLRSMVRWRKGDLAATEADAVEAMRLADSLPDSPPLLAAAVSSLGLVAVERGGDLDSVHGLLDALDDADGAPYGLLLHARGRLAAAAGRLDEAATSVLAAGRFDTDLGISNPSVLQWRSDAARLLRLQDRGAEARSLALEELERARAFGAARGVGVALSGLAAVTDGAERIALLEEAVDTLAASPAHLERARAEVELGKALRRSRDLTVAREWLRRGLDGAGRCGSTRLSREAVDELRATGAKPRRTAVTGVDSLTPSERRVTELAATGLSNRMIAQQLFVSEKTVETHLSHAYDKLGVRARTALPSLLGTVDSA